MWKYNGKVTVAQVVLVEGEYGGHRRCWNDWRRTKRKVSEEFRSQGLAKQRLRIWTRCRYQTRTSHLTLLLPLLRSSLSPSSLRERTYRSIAFINLFSGVANHIVIFKCQICARLWNPTVKPCFIRTQVSSTQGFQLAQTLLRLHHFSVWKDRQTGSAFLHRFLSSLPGRTSHRGILRTNYSATCLLQGRENLLPSRLICC